MLDRELAVAYRPLDSLVPYARNARTHSEAQVAEIAGSIREFGFTNPVLIAEDGTLIAGHGRVLAARLLGMDTVPTISLNGSLPSGYFNLGAAASISNIDAAIDSISATRSTFGAVQNRLEHSVNAAQAYSENLVAAESRIRDVDMAEEMTNLTRLQER